MGDLQKFLKSLERPKKNNIAFGSGSVRKTLPEEKFTTRLSLVYIKPKGKPSVGPGMHNVQDTFNIVKESGQKIANNNGYTYRTEPRFKKMYDIPCTQFDYMEKPKPIKPAAKPFGSGCPTFQPLLKSITEVPGPGTYTGIIMPKEKIRRMESFGGKIITVPPVTIKCVPIYEDRCSECKKAPIGVYHQSKTEILCRKCYDKLKTRCQRTRPTKRSEKCEAFQKVRDCSFCHDHQRATAAVWTKPLSLLHRQQVLETYFNKYFS